jgi:flagellar basal body-associated protein FliL
MADEQAAKTAEQKPETKPDAKSEAKPGSSGKMVWIVMAGVAVGSAVCGFGISKLSANTSLNVFRPATEEKPTAAEEIKLTIEKASGKESPWYCKLEPVVANLDEPGALRYIRLAVFLEMDGSAEQEQCQKFIDSKKPLLNNWMQLYLAGRSLEEVKGDKYLKTMQAQMLEGFNQILFPNGKSLIKGVLFGEINIQ